MQNAMILAIHYLGTFPSDRDTHREGARRYADRFCAYLEQHNALLFAMRDPGVSLEAFIRMNDEIRTNALELKKLRIEVRIREARQVIPVGPYVRLDDSVKAACSAPRVHRSMQAGAPHAWMQPLRSKPIFPEDQ